MNKIYLSLILLLFTVVSFAGTDDLYPTYDLAPGVIPHNVPQTDPMWDLQYEYSIEAACGDNGLLGIEFDWINNEIWISGRGVSAENQIYRVNPITSEYLGMFPTGTNSLWGVRDMCHDNLYIYGGEDSGLHCFDPVTQTNIATLPWPAGMQFPRANAYDPATDHFYCGNFGTTCYEMDRQGNLIRSWNPAPLTAIYGMAWDNNVQTDPWLWMIDQINPSSGCNFHQVDPVTLTYTGVVHQLNPPSAVNPISGGGEHVFGIDPCFDSFLSLGQGTPDCGAAWEGYLIELWGPGPATNFLVEHNNEELVASLSWINPSVYVSGDPLWELDGMKIYRNDVLTADIPMDSTYIGQPYAYEDSVPSAGLYDYTIVGYIQSSNGMPVSEQAWIGLDVPGAPQNVEAIPNPNWLLETTITWEPPTSGEHGAYFPPGSWDGQKIYRNGVMVADLTGTNTQYIDYPLIQGFYEYGVSYYNSSGEGPLGWQPMVFVGPINFTSIPYNWIEISGIGTNINMTEDDQNLGPFPMGISFPYLDGNVYNQIRICSNGWLSFTSSSTTSDNTWLPNPGEPNNTVCPFWDDLVPGNGNCYYYYDQVNSRFIVQYDDWGQSGYPNSILSFEAIFYPVGVIDFMYQTIEGNPDLCTVGVENQNGTTGDMIFYNGIGGIEPQSQTGIRFAWCQPPPPNIDITLNPIGAPIIIPANGGTFSFNAIIENEGYNLLFCEIWTMATLPDGSEYGPIIDVTIPLAGQVVIERTRNQVIPASAPTGDYTYDGYIGIYPNTIYDEDHFDFEKTAADNGGGIYSDWSNWGESFEDIGDDALETVETFALHDAHPNPFNPETQLTFTLPEAGEVSLKIFDISGREVESLVTGHLSLGEHTVTFNASGLSSGVYFARLSSEGRTDVKKLILLK